MFSPILSCCFFLFRSALVSLLVLMGAGRRCCCHRRLENSRVGRSGDERHGYLDRKTGSLRGRCWLPPRPGAALCHRRWNQQRETSRGQEVCTVRGLLQVFGPAEHAEHAECVAFRMSIWTPSLSPTYNSNVFFAHVEMPEPSHRPVFRFACFVKSAHEHGDWSATARERATGYVKRFFFRGRARSEGNDRTNCSRVT